MKEFKLPPYLEAYENSSYDEQVRVTFIYNFMKVMVYLLIPLTFYTYWIQSISSVGFFKYYPVAIEIIAIVIYIFLIRQIREGTYIVYAHLGLILAFIINWIIMFFSQTNIFMRLTSVSYILAVLSVTPILISKRQHIWIYSIFNIFFVALFGLFAYIFYDISKFIFYDFISDNIFSIIILTLAVTTAKHIYDSLIEKSLSDLNSRKQAEEQLKKVNEELEVIVEERTKALKETLEKLEISNLELNILNSNLTT